MTDDLARINLTLYEAIEQGDEREIKQALLGIIKLSHRREVGVEFVERILKVKGIEIGDHLRSWMKEEYEALESA